MFLYYFNSNYKRITNKYAPNIHPPSKNRAVNYLLYGQFRKSLTVNDLARKESPKSLSTNDLGKPGFRKSLSVSRLRKCASYAKIYLRNS
jgi:hypothetical protein